MIGAGRNLFLIALPPTELFPLVNCILKDTVCGTAPGHGDPHRFYLRRFGTMFEPLEEGALKKRGRTIGILLRNECRPKSLVGISRPTVWGVSTVSGAMLEARRPFPRPLGTARALRGYSLPCTSVAQTGYGWQMVSRGELSKTNDENRKDGEE